jgi:pentatricopeptide repeat protein
MEAQGFKPDSVTHSMVIENLCIGGKVKEAESFLNNLEDTSEETYTALIRGYCEANLTRKAYELLSRFAKHGTINKGACFKVLSNLCMEGDNDSAILLLERMLALNVEPKRIMYSKLIASLCQAEEVQKARLFFDSLVEKGFTPDVIDYTMLINGYCRGNSLREAHDLFHDMKKRGIQPDIITYTVLLDGFSKRNIRRVRSPLDARRNREEMVDASTVLWTEMKEMGIRPDVICYTVLIDRHCKTDNLQDAIALFDVMIDRGLKPDTVTYTALLSGCCNRGDVDRAITLVNEMSSKGMQLDDCTLLVLRHGILKAKKVQFRK